MIRTHCQDSRWSSIIICSLHHFLFSVYLGWRLAYLILLLSRRAGISSSFCTCALYTAHIDEQVSASLFFFFALVTLLDTI
jgi:hypothetical protein